MTSTQPLMHKLSPRAKSARHWKPLPLRPAYQISLIVITALCISAIEVVVQKSGPSYSLVPKPGDGSGDFSAGANFVYLYLPTLLSVIYSIAWTWLDHDAKRLEPYFQMSRGDGVGALAGDSLHLDYPTINGFVTPFVSFKKRHWVVLGSSLSTLVVALVVTPLVGSVLAVKLITLTSSHSFQTTASFDPSRIANATSSFTYPAFAWNYLNASMPEMMTETFAVAPFQPRDFIPKDGENWTVPTTMYWATLACNLALLVNQTTGNSSASRELYVGDGQNWLADFPKPVPSRSVNKDLYGPWVYNINLTSTLYPAHEDPTTGRILRSDPVSTPLEFYFVLLQYPTSYGSANYVPPSSAHPVFCKPAYWSAPVSITTLWEGNRSTIMNWTMTGSQQPLQFDTTQLSNLWVKGIFEEKPIELQHINPLDSLPVPRNFFNTTPLYRGEESPIHARIWSGGAPLSNLASWTFSNAHSDYEGLLDNKTPDLSNSLNSSLNNLFAFAMQSVLQNPNSNNGPQTAIGTRQFTSLAITIDPTLSRLLEGALGALIICACIVLYFSHNSRQPSNLSSDPDSLGSTMSLMADSNGLLTQLRGSDSSNVHGYSSVDGLLNGGVYFSLHSNEDGSIQLESYAHKDEGPSAIELEQAPIALRSSIDLFADSFEEQQRAFKRPLELNVFMGVSIALMFAALLIYGSVLYSMSSFSQGLDPVTNNEFAFQLLFSYLPIIIGTAIGPFWIMIAKYIAILAPLNVMVMKSKSSASTISSKMSGLPPELSLLRILKMRHWRLAAVSVCIILSNILAVMLSSLFQETYVRVTRTAAFVPTPYTSFQNRSITDGYGPFYTVYSQLALNASVSSWTNEDYYFWPFQLSDHNYPRNSSDRYKATTLGIGADLDCQPIRFEFNSSTAGVSTGAQLTAAGSSWVVALNVANTLNGSASNHNFTSAPEGVCMSGFGGIDTNLLANLTHPHSQLKALYAWPDWTIMEDYNPWGDPTNNCANLFPVVALNAGLSVDAQNFTTPIGLEAQSLLCKSIVKFGMFNVTVTPSGAVQEAVLINNLTEAPNSSKTISWKKKINSELQIANSFFPDNFGSNGQRYLSRRPFESYAATNWALILASLNVTSQLDANKWNGTSVPPISAITDELSSIYRKLFVEYLALDANSTLPVMMGLTPINSSAPISGQSTITLRRVLVSRTSFIASALIIGVFLLTIVAVYVRPMDKGLPFVPISLGATLAFVHGSEALEDVKGTSGFSTRQREKHLKRLGHRYFIGWRNGEVGDGSNAPRQYGVHKESSG